MAKPGYIIGLLLVIAGSLAAVLQPIAEGWSPRSVGNEASTGFIESMMGESRRLFAKQAFIKADIYMHSGYYPSIFDRARGGTEKAAGTAECEHDHANGEKCQHDHGDGRKCDHEFLGRSRDWIDLFGRNFYHSEHSHLGDGSDGRAGVKHAEREILPWLRLAASLDPEHVESYTVASFWLRKMNRAGEAETFLREGLRVNPRRPEILFELGNVMFEDRKDLARGRNLLQTALARWEEQEKDKPAPNLLLKAQILGDLVKIETRADERGQAIAYLQKLREISGQKDEVDKRIADVLRGEVF